MGHHAQKITQFDGETVKKMMTDDISTFLSTVDNLKMSPEGFDLDVTRTVSRARMRFRHIVEQRAVVPVLQIRKEIGEVTLLIPEEITDVSHAKGVRWKEAGIHNEVRVRSG